ncbi:hypothetical protein FQN57_005195 [Myotisia sp. PD_48]|nr:hypothetical protein FQN57_005195 [Myotisia sp. PD_48]
MADYYDNHPYNHTSSTRYPDAHTNQPRPQHQPQMNHQPYAGEDTPYTQELPHQYPSAEFSAAYAPEPPYNDRYYRPERRSHSVGADKQYYHSSRGTKYRNDDYRDKDYQRGRRHDHKHRSGRSYSESSPSRTPPGNNRKRKSLGEQALKALGLGEVVESLGLKQHRSRSRSRSRSNNRDRRERHYHRDGVYDSKGYYRRRPGSDDHLSRPNRGRHQYGSDSESTSSSRASSRYRSPKDLRHTLTAAVTAGVAEAYRARKEPGGWTGEKGKRILTAAVGAGGADKLIEAHGSGKHSTRHIIESTLAGLATNHMLNGPRGNSRSRRSDGRGRRRAHSASFTPADLLSGELVAAVGKKAFERYQGKAYEKRYSKSGYSTDDEHNDHRQRHHRRSSNKKRSKSVSEYLGDAISALNMHNEGKKRSSGRGHSSRRHGPADDGYADPYRRSRHSSRHHGGYQHP